MIVEAEVGRSLQTFRPLRVLRTTVLGVWRRHQDLLSNAGSLLGTTGITSALGFFYWVVAARLLSQEAVGYGSAAVSVMGLLGTIGIFGLGTLLIGELPRRSRRAGLISAALLASGLGSLVLGLGFALVAQHVSRQFVVITGTPGRTALFAVGVALTGVTMVFDQATIGLMRGGLQLWRNSVLSIAKLLVLPVITIILNYKLGMGIVLSWVLGAALSLFLVAVRLQFSGTSVLHWPDWVLLKGFGRTAMAHNWLNIAATVPISVLPVIVTVTVSPSASAAFYVATMLVGFLFIIPSHLATVLFAIAAADPKIIARKLRFALRVSYLIGLPAMAALILGSHLTLAIFGKGYASEAALPMALLALGYPLYVPKALYIAVCRATGRIVRAAVVLSVCSAIDVGAAAVGGVLGGLKGLAIALLAARVVEAMLTAPAVIRASFGQGRHRRGESSISPDWDQGSSYVRSPSLSADIEYAARQEAGLAALLSLATCVPTTSPIPIVRPSRDRPPNAGIRKIAQRDQPLHRAAGADGPGGRRGDLRAPPYQANEPGLAGHIQESPLHRRREAQLAGAARADKGRCPGGRYRPTASPARPGTAAPRPVP
jgi:O-antigen/teichoic acid export membrane protein